MKSEGDFQPFGVRPMLIRYSPFVEQEAPLPLVIIVSSREGGNLRLLS